MSEFELMNERRVIYETRLEILGYTQSEIPIAEHHNLAVDEAEAHIERIKASERSEIQGQFELLRRTL